VFLLAVDDKGIQIVNNAPPTLEVATLIWP
jgi:hypothetical protein